MNIVPILFNLPLLLLSISIHEFSHGWVAYKLGDNTAKYAGRLTLNPLKHIDPMGTIILPLFLFIATQGRFVFGAAKPVPINYSALKNPKKDIIWVGASGPLSNFILAIFSSAILKTIPLPAVLQYAIFSLLTINVILCVFNLIPIPPLDGSRVIMGILPRSLAAKYAILEDYGFFLIMLLIFLGMFGAIIEPAANAILSWLL